MQNTKAERLFSGSIGQEYDMLKVICPSAAKVSQRGLLMTNPQHDPEIDH